MPKTAPLTPAASRLKALQSARLKALRELVEPYKKDAAEVAGVSEHSWGRYEANDKSGINPLALAAFALAYKVPAEWVLTGRLTGMPDDLISKLYEGYPQLLAASREGSEAPLPQPEAPSRTRARASRTPGTAKAGMRASPPKLPR
jgi:transcriptional regulator with XRE-family HTH domain